MLTIFEYENANKFLYDAWEAKKKRNPSFSMRAWAQKMGFQNMAPLSLMLSGKRPISKKYITNFIDDLSLTSIEGLYLENLIEYNRAISPEKKEFYFKRLQDLHPKKEIRFEEVEMHDFFKDPIHFYLLDIIDLPESVDDVHWIKNNLEIDYPILEIKKALQRLVDHEFIRHAGNRYFKLKDHFTNKIDVPSQTVQDYHKACAMNAIESLQKQDVSQREFNGFVLTMNKEKMLEAKKDIRAFYAEFISKYEAKDEANCVYQLNVQFFKIFESIQQENL
jgi:uncharacterized protein (TIGR02147 family)